MQNSRLMTFARNWKLILYGASVRRVSNVIIPIAVDRYFSGCNCRLINEIRGRRGGLPLRLKIAAKFDGPRTGKCFFSEFHISANNCAMKIHRDTNAL